MESQVTLPRSRRIVYSGIGLAATGLGILGIILPIMPTTIFLIIASAFFLKAHPPLYRWLHRSRVLGPYLAVYTRKQGLSVVRKLIIIGILWGTMAISIVFVAEALWLRLLLAAIGVGVTLHVALLKTYRAGDQVEIETAGARREAQ